MPKLNYFCSAMNTSNIKAFVTKKHITTCLLTFGLLCLVTSAFAQKKNVRMMAFTTSGRAVETIQSEDAFDALAIAFDSEPTGSASIRDQSDIPYQLTIDEHVEDRIQSNLIIFPHRQNRVTLTGIEGGRRLLIYFITIPELNISLTAYRNNGDCSEPAVVPQSVWRAGLNPPTPGRKATPTRHCIVHHSASSNADTNSVKLVRGFYLYHTEVNGWDDIGYNYLIGYDGTIFAGRDPEKPGIRQDNVLGAHFCGKNSYTMGVCVIGDFETEAPDPRAVGSLRHLLSWKMFKDKMNPLDSLHHPDTINGELLPVLAGHRNGCSTDCPGQLLFDMLPQLRLDVKADIEECTRLGSNDMERPTLKVFPNPASEEVTIKHPGYFQYELLSINGCPAGKGTGNDTLHLDVSGFIPGIYILTIKSGIYIQNERLIILR